MRDDSFFGWRRERLSGLCLKSNQKDPRKDPDSSFIYVDVSSISNHSFSIIDTNRVMGKDAPSRARKLIQRDDVIFATVRPTLKRVALVTKEFHGQICSTGFCVLRANKDLLDPNFLYYYLLTEGVTDRVDGLQKGATYPAISDSDLFNQTILLPPLPEQRAIARALRAVQGAREARLREVALERERKAALMEHLFTKGTRGEATKQTEIGEMPESWKIGKLGDFIKFKSGESRPANMVSKSEAEKIVPVYGGNGIMGYTNDIFSEKEHLIIGRVGEYCGCIHISERLRAMFSVKFSAPFPDSFTPNP